MNERKMEKKSVQIFIDQSSVSASLSLTERRNTGYFPYAALHVITSLSYRRASSSRHAVRFADRDSLTTVPVSLVEVISPVYSVDAARSCRGLMGCVTGMSWLD